MTIFHTSHCKVTYPRIKINNSSVEIVDEFKFLRIFIDIHCICIDYIQVILYYMLSYPYLITSDSMFYELFTLYLYIDGHESKPAISILAIVQESRKTSAFRYFSSYSFYFIT